MRKDQLVNAFEKAWLRIREVIIQEDRRLGHRAEDVRFSKLIGVGDYTRMCVEIIYESEEVPSQYFALDVHRVSEREVDRDRERANQTAERSDRPASGVGGAG